MIDSSTLEKLEFKKVLNYISNYCITEPGKQQIQDLLPTGNSELIDIEGRSVSEAKEILIQSVPPPIDFIPDLKEIISRSRIEGSVLSAKSILDVYKLSVISRKLAKFLKENNKIAPLLAEYSSKLIVDKVFEHHIEKVINENGDVKEMASNNLFQIRNDIREKQSELIKSVNKIMKSLEEKGMVREEYLTLRDGRMVIPVKVEHKRHLRGFIHSESATGQTVYIEPEQTLELNNEIVSLNFAEKREIEKLLKDLTRLISTKNIELLNSLEIISYLDSVFARAKYSIEILGSFPQIDPKKSLTVIDARHPVLFKKLGRQNTVPISFELDKANVVIITGPNAGGKTVVLKTIGLLTVLLQSGIHIPASPDSNFQIFENILIDIGDEQSIEDDLSTFSSHLLNIKKILSYADSKSLVLLDEIGTGTDPAEGSALAAAVLKKLRDKYATVFASTHHGNLKLIAHNSERFVNAAMEFDHENLSPTYKFKLGIPGSSYAFEIARRIGIDEDILSDASKNIDKEKYKVEKFLIELEAKSGAIEKKLVELEAENIHLADLSSLYKKNLDTLEKEKKEILKKAKEDSQNYLDEINKRIEKIIKDIKESNASKETIKEAKKIIEESKEITKNLYDSVDEKTDTDLEINIGSYVKIKNTSAAGKIIHIDKQKNKAVVESGNIKMNVRLDELISTKENGNSKFMPHRDFEISNTPYRIDIRGKKPHECETEVIKFIDDSHMAGHDRIEILHGKGTGALKKMVKEILNNFDAVKNYYFASIESGGDGITIVELK